MMGAGRPLYVTIPCSTVWLTSISRATVIAPLSSLPRSPLPASRFPSPPFPLPSSLTVSPRTPLDARVDQIFGARPKAERNSSCTAATIRRSRSGGASRMTAPPHPAPVIRAPHAPWRMAEATRKSASGQLAW